MVQFKSDQPGDASMRWYRDWFDVSGTVGWGGSNHKDDVMLVQLLLRRHFMWQSSMGSPTKEALILKVDGIVGDKTVGAIESYQRHAPRLSIPNVDGKVTPGHQTIRSLNVDYNVEYPGYMGKPYLDPEAPPLLVSSTTVAQASVAAGLPVDIGY